MFRLKHLIPVLFIGLFLTASCHDPCERTQCLNGATCNSGTCTCVLGWEGDHCDVASTDKFLGSWESDWEAGNIGASVFTVSINHGTDRKRFLMYNFDNVFIDPVYADLTSDVDFNIPAQDPDGDGFSVSGDGYYISDSLGTDLHVSYTVTDLNGGNSSSAQGWWHFKGY